MTCNLYMMSITFLEVEIQNLRSIQIEMFNLEANILLTNMRVGAVVFWNKCYIVVHVHFH